MTTILIVEDDKEISSRLQSMLNKNGYEAYCVDDFENIIATFTSHNPKMVLLDVNLPFYDGYYWCRQIRLQSNCPILFISAREGKMDQVMALENGADDYITKPFELEVVLAKIRSHFRRAYGDYALTNAERLLNVNGLLLYLNRYELLFQGQKIELSKKELVLMEVLMNEVEQVVSRHYLLEKLWDENTFVDDNTLNVYITRVRKKLKDIGIVGAIEVVRGVGYRLKTSWRG
ncbi:response regulator transcription factor [Shimazuella sp. AN120528]|uniref:response regulator transcription factor n=1 Tax=Shimazuella soli TaxID=1892854 RepID=UPI001F0EEF06|nr:response regulator transcription factor [Shimazuella soli]MCH5583982.1 response regulator transcription factor [Shimazuella soli]